MSLTIWSTEKGMGVFTQTPIPFGTIVLTFDQTFIDHPTQHTLRVDLHRHQLSKDPNAFENFVNHSCNPNTSVDWNTLSLVANRNINENEEITYDYMTSDWDHEDPFLCLCGSHNCRGYLYGAKYLSEHEQHYMFMKFSPFIREMILGDYNAST